MDGNAMAGNGYPFLNVCPLPDFVVVHFPEYTGPALFPNLPGTWVPIAPASIANKQSKKYVRTGLPLQLADALTIHKAQGVSAPEGTIVSLQTTSKTYNPVANTPGLAFVGWTRVTKWARMAFVALPPLGDFYAVRLTKGFQQREQFEACADDAHDLFMESRGVSKHDEIAAHVDHLRHSLQEEPLHDGYIPGDSC